MSATLTHTMTADELLLLPRGTQRYALIEGELITMSPAGHNHGRIAMEIAIPLGSYVKAHKLGRVYAAETGFKIAANPDTVIAPDVAFIRQARVAAGADAQGYWQGAPDLAVEVISPNDRPKKVETKVEMWLAAGAREVWVIRPRLKNVTIYRSLTDVIVLAETDALEGGDVIPGFSFPVAEIFA